MAEERVLCFERNLFEKLGVFQGMSLEVEKYLPVVTATANVRYLNRSEAELDKRYKQLIPYALIICGDKILAIAAARAEGKRVCTACIPWAWAAIFRRRTTACFPAGLDTTRRCGAS